MTWYYFFERKDFSALGTWDLCSFLTCKSRFAHSMEEQEKSSWARSLDLGGMCREAWQLGSTLELSFWQLPASPILDFFCQYQPGTYLSKWHPDGFFWACSWTSHERWRHKCFTTQCPKVLPDIPNWRKPSPSAGEVLVGIAWLAENTAIPVQSQELQWHLCWGF